MFNVCIYLLMQIQLPRDIYLKLEHFFRKMTLIEKNIRLHDVLNGINSIKFLEILNSKKTPNIFSTYQLKITFKHLNFARKPFFNVFQNMHTPGFILHRKYPSNVF